MDEYSRAKYRTYNRTDFLFIFVCSRIMKEYPILCDKIEVIKRKGCNPDEERQINCIDRCCSAIIISILILELETNNTKS